MVKQSNIEVIESTSNKKENFQDWCDKNKNKIFAPTKYYKAQKDLVIRKTEECFATTPEMPLKKVIIDIMTPLPDFLPADNLIKVVGYIVKTWEKELAKNLTATK